MTDTTEPSLSYRDAGVDIERGDRLAGQIGQLVRPTYRPEVLAGVGGFASLFRVPVDRYRRPVLVSATDGVGTKLRLAIETGLYDTIGIDLVAMCANDVLAHGAEPLLFLDYLAMAQLDEEIVPLLVKGMARGCELAGASLVGGECAEMPGLYRERDFDLAGFCVGVVEEDRIIDGSGIQPGDPIIGLRSNGLHANGFSLARRVLELTGARLDAPAPFEDDGGASLGECLMRPTRIYVRAVRSALGAVPDAIRGIAHITGGGLAGNLVRILPEQVGARLDQRSWQRCPVAQWLGEAGGIAEEELLRTFNCGIGMTLVVAAAQADDLLRALRDADADLDAKIIGETTRAGDTDGEARVEIVG